VGDRAHRGLGTAGGPLRAAPPATPPPPFEAAPPYRSPPPPHMLAHPCTSPPIAKLHQLPSRHGLRTGDASSIHEVRTIDA
jgi:hypothetical protein